MLLNNLKFLRSQDEKRVSLFSSFQITYWDLFCVKVLTSHLLDTIHNKISVNFIYELLKKLREQDSLTTGTVRNYRTSGATGILKFSIDLQKKETVELLITAVMDKYICASGMNDNAVVGTASNFLTHEPVRIAR